MTARSISTSGSFTGCQLPGGEWGSSSPISHSGPLFPWPRTWAFHSRCRDKRSQRRRQVGEVLTLLRIDSLAGKRPDQLSPAQSLRVALARAIVTEPELLILDEPLEPFDSRGREEAWDEIRRLRGELGITTMLLTRVVPEALAYADRLAVMDLGRILQVGPPCELYNHPADVFVARFLGPTNLIQGQVDNPTANPGARSSSALPWAGLLPG